LRKATISFIFCFPAFVYSSDCPHGTTELPIDVFSGRNTFAIFT